MRYPLGVYPHAYPPQPLQGDSAPSVFALPLTRVECLSSLEAVRRHGLELEALRLRSRAAWSLLPLPAWEASRHVARGWKQRVILLQKGERLDAAVFLQEQTFFGLPTGYFRGGDAVGDMLVLCDAGQEASMVALAVRLLLRSHRAFLILLDQPETAAAAASAVQSFPGIRQRSCCNVVHWQHRLEAVFDDTVASFGHRTRRNLRHALRRVAQQGWQFSPDLTSAELESALSYLGQHSTHPFPATIRANRLGLIRSTEGSFAMGLRDDQGQWLSCLIGRRIAGVTEVFWQANVKGKAGDSLCTAMRALLMQQEIASGSGAVQYVGGTCPLMQHCCTPAESQQTSFGRPGLRLALMTLLLRTRLASAGHPLRRHLGRANA